jgi:hypothetical protein
MCREPRQWRAIAGCCRSRHNSYVRFRPQPDTQPIAVLARKLPLVQPEHFLAMRLTRGTTMKLPIRNYTPDALTLFIEPQCDEHEIPSGGEAIVLLQDDRPHSIDVHPDGFIALWDEGSAPLATVQVFPDQQHSRGFVSTQRPRVDVDGSSVGRQLGDIKRRAIIITLAAAIVSVSAGWAMRGFIATDRCLDRGGAWNGDLDACTLPRRNGS